MFEGAYSAIITPFKEGDSAARPAIDYEALESFVEWQLAEGLSGLVVCGTTGESATLTLEERFALISRVVELVKGRVPVIAGTGNNSTADSIEMTKRASVLGVDAALVVAPYYNKPTQEGLYEHFRAIAKEGGLPLVVYNVPSRCGVEISVETLSRLADLDGVVAIKQAVDSASKLIELAGLAADKVDILAGNCEITYFVMTVGGKGVISATANVIPALMSEIVSAGLKGDFSAAFGAQKRALPVIKAMFSESNPIPIKAALLSEGRIPSEARRLPLPPAQQATRELCRRVLK